MTEFTEDRVFARHARRRGAVLIVGVGAVGSLTAQQLVRMGISPLWLLDPDVLEGHNVVRHYLGADDVGKNKARALASRIRREFPLCEAHGSSRDFLDLSWGERVRRVGSVDLVVAATDVLECQQAVNRACLAAEVPAVYPGVWVDPRVRDAEVSEVLWVLPGRHTPCYQCAVTFRQGSLDAQAARGAMVDIEQAALATARIVEALLDPADESSAILDPERTLIYLHGLTPTSPGIRDSFPVDGLFSRNIEVPFPPEPCPACGAQDDAEAAFSRVPVQDPARPWLTSQPVPPTSVAADTQPRSWSPDPFEGAFRPRGLLLLLLILGTVGVLVWWLVSLQLKQDSSAHQGAAPSNSQTTTPPPGQATSRLSLVCDPTIGGSECAGKIYGVQGAVALDITGMSANGLYTLCNQGYDIAWTDNHGQVLSRNSGYACSAYAGTEEVTIEQGTTNGAGPAYVYFTAPEPPWPRDPPWAGPWNITMRLTNPAGRIVLIATYDTTVVS